ncbi:MAG: DUF192 domain-containing protein [Eggerthellaceae bacterium]|nr:DUF192 domain-containing protein [Eggerthellaceae bacterium]
MNEQDFEGRVFLLAGFFERVKGLLFEKPKGQMVLLIPCKRVHTFGMRHNLDIAFLDRGGRVLAAYQNVPPSRSLVERRATGVLERFSNESILWLKAGERLRFMIDDKQKEKKNEDLSHM